MGQSCWFSSAAKNEGASYEELITAFGGLGGDARLAFIVAGLARIAEEHPYLKPTGTEYAPHHLLYWVRRCREFTLAHKLEDAEGCFTRIESTLERELAQIADTFKRFDIDGSQELEWNEFKYMCAYIGWGEEEAKLMDLNEDQKVTLQEFQRFVGHMGGLMKLFEVRRQRIARKQWGTEAPALIEIGSRVKAHYHTPDGKKSSDYRECQVLEMHVMPNNGVKVLFGFGEGPDVKQERQIVPQSWIFSDTRDSEVIASLREVGILDEQQAFWAAIFPESEMRAIQKLVPRQRAALAHVRSNATANHERALPEVRARFEQLGYDEEVLQCVFGWIQDLAPTCVHLYIDKVGRFLEVDEYYRNQFETGTSEGALDSGNTIRIGWENELFGGCYDGSKPFERCKYGALGVMNDYRGITSAYQYGDSYMVLKDVRLRCTFAATDSGGIAGTRLAVLDKYAHVLKEYNDRELHSLVQVAVANTSRMDVPGSQPRLLRGMNVDTTAEWVTMGFPDLSQKKGRYFFEISFSRGCASPQGGLLSSKFTIAPRTLGYQGGVGDDEFGWSADGQHAILWHNGEKLPWNRCWKSSDGNALELSDDVVLGVAVDIEERKIWFASEGEWDDESTPSFGPDRIPIGIELYPALSMKGRSSFNFGPDFKHNAPEFKGSKFVQWPGAAAGIAHADCPIIGNSDNVGIYKEIQIHGEVSLKHNVQRLVANRKHLELSKNQRSWAIIVDGVGTAARGTYNRSGAKSGMPVYSQQQGDHVVFCDQESKMWRIARSDQAETWIAQAPIVDGSFDVPRQGWEAPRQSRGVASLEIFKKGMAKAGVSSSHCQKLVDALVEDDNKEKVIFRVGANTSFEAEWAKLREEWQAELTAHEAWKYCVKAAQEEVMAESGLAAGTVVIETDHPYEAKAHSWTREVTIESAKSLKVVYSSKCRTYDDCAHFSIYAGGLSKSAAGIGARAHVKAWTGPDQVHGTLSGRAEGGKWIVNIDSDESEICGGFREWMDASPARRCFTVCAQDPKCVSITFTDGMKVGDEIEGFKFDPACPLTPVSIAGFKAVGPAQLEGVMAGWFLDIVDLLQDEAFQDMEGDFGEMPRSMSDIAIDLKGFEKRLQALLEITDVTLQFHNGLDFQLLPIVCADYSGKTVGNEISGFDSNGGVVTITGLKGGTGPAKAAGAKDGWHVNLFETFTLEDNKASFGVDDWQVTQASILEDPSPLLSMSNIKLMLEPATAEAEEYSKAFGDDFQSCTIPFNSAQFVFTTDGDGSSAPNNRWGVFAIVTSSDETELTEAAMEELSTQWNSASNRVLGFEQAVSVEPEDWDEPRLKALCDKHGWEFEWMTEDGERRRRIEGAERARRAAAKSLKESEGEKSAWWRMGSVAKAFNWSKKHEPAQQKRILQRPPQFNQMQVGQSSSKKA
eukprot:TRINITY_DN25693_c0_g1_i1.p1 TRINITY_DN25693_c0_g1~~TRINITY_DN25693_c0_g1_i1.p1  ORF type:complete len:1416 (-),score=266.94 TRINITY_DN25693_c0_g1_i1:75-4322(-)